MPRIEFKATELTNTDVHAVSLVKRGANRIPFRIVKKEDEPMLDLYKAVRSMFQKEDVPPSIVAIVVKRELDASTLKVLAKACGLDASLKKSEEDEIVRYAKEDAKLDKAFLVKLDDNVAVAVSHTNLQNAFLDQEYVLGPSALRKSFDGLIQEALAKADNIVDSTEIIRKASEDFNVQLSLLAEYLPDVVVKADQVLAKCSGTGNAMGGAGMDQETGDGLSDQANKRMKKDDLGTGDTDQSEADPEMPAKGDKIGTRAAKGDGGAGKNGTGEGVEMGQGTGTTPSATDDDEEEEIDAAPGERVSGDNSGMPAKAKAPTQKAAPNADDVEEDDDSTTGAQSDLPAKAKAPTKKMAGKPGDQEVRTVGSSGEGARQAGDKGQDLDTRDDVEEDPPKTQGQVKGKTLEMDGVPAKAKAPTQKNDGDADLGRKGKGNEEPDEMSGSGAQAQDVQSYQKADVEGLMQAISSLAKSVQAGQESLTKSVTELSTRVDAVSAVARKTEAALGGTVFVEDAEERATWTRKSESNAPPLLDTGFSRRGAA